MPALVYYKEKCPKIYEDWNVKVDISCKTYQCPKFVPYHCSGDIPFRRAREIYS